MGQQILNTTRKRGLSDMLKMNAFIRDNAIIVRNFERLPERPVFNRIVDAFEADKKISIKRKIEGPYLDIVTAECKGGEVSVSYDIDYGICPIRCTKENIKEVFEIVDRVINKITE